MKPRRNVIGPVCVFLFCAFLVPVRGVRADALPRIQVSQFDFQGPGDDKSLAALMESTVFQAIQKTGLYDAILERDQTSGSREIAERGLLGAKDSELNAEKILKHDLECQGAITLDAATREMNLSLVIKDSAGKAMQKIPFEGSASDILSYNDRLFHTVYQRLTGKPLDYEVTINGLVGAANFNAYLAYASAAETFRAYELAGGKKSGPRALFSKSVTEAQRAASLDPGFDRPFALLGRLYTLGGQKKEAEAAYRRFLELYGKRSAGPANRYQYLFVLGALGHLLAGDGNLKEAIGLWTDEVAARRSGPAERNLGYALVELGGARVDFARMANAVPGNTLLEKESLEEGINNLREGRALLLSLGENRNAIFGGCDLDLGRAYFLLGQYKDALKSFEASIQTLQGIGVAPLLLADALSEAGFVRMRMDDRNGSLDFLLKSQEIRKRFGQTLTFDYFQSARAIASIQAASDARVAFQTLSDLSYCDRPNLQPRDNDLCARSAYDSGIYLLMKKAPPALAHARFLKARMHAERLNEPDEFMVAWILFRLAKTDVSSDHCSSVPDLMRSLEIMKRNPEQKNVQNTVGEIEDWLMQLDYFCKASNSSQ